METRSISKEELKLILPGKVGVSGGREFYFTCPVCNKEKHAYINFKTFLWNCKRCGKSGNLYSILKLLNRLDLLQGFQVDFTELIKPLNQTDEKELIDFTVPDKKLPAGYKKLSFNKDNKYSRYLKQRKFSKIDFELYEPGVTFLLERYSEYVIIPIFQDFSIKGFVGRYIGGDSDKRRYENSKNTKFAKIIGGYDEITINTHTLIIVEGFFDKVSVTTELKLHNDEEFKCVCTWGKKISDHQIELIRKTKVKHIYLFYDQDAIIEVKSYGIKLAQFFHVMGCYVTSKKDPAEMTHDEILDTLDSAQNIRDFAISKVQINKLK